MENYTDNQLVSFIQKGNSDAFVELTARYLSFIRAKAHPFRSSVLEADDLCQEGLLGLFSAARSYNPNKDASFKTYAGICIQNRIVAAYRACARKKNIPLGPVSYTHLEQKVALLKLTIDTTICPVIEYFEIFLTRMVLCRKAADFLGLTFQIVVNDARIL